MAVGTPESGAQVEDRIKADVQREAPDSDPYLTVHWLRSLIAGIARRIFDFYGDLNRTETRLFPDTADDETASRWGNIYVGPPTPATGSSGQLVATGTAGGTIGAGVVLTAGGEEYTVSSGGAVAAQEISVTSLTRSGTTATATTASDHGLSSFVPVTIAGADQTEYNLTDAAITVTGLNTFEYTVAGSPAFPATGTITAAFTAVNVTVNSTGFGESTNLAADTAAALQSPIVNVDDTLFVTFAEVGGGTEEESTADYIARYLEKIRNPVAHFNESDIESKAKEVAGVTRVFVNPAGTEISTVAVTSITRTGNVATVTTTTPHGLVGGEVTTIADAVETDYNVIDTEVIVESTTVFHYVVANTPTSPATGTITATTSIPLGQVRTFFMRDNDDNAIPSASEIQTVKDKIDEILPANTATDDNIVAAPLAVPSAYVFTALTPNTGTMQAAIDANLDQFYAEQASVGTDVDEDAYRAAIKNTVDPDTGDIVATFELSSPSGDIAISFGEIATKGSVTF